MGFGQRIQEQREALGLTRPELAAQLGVSPSAVSNYERGISFPKEEVLLRLFDCLDTQPNVLFQDSFRGRERSLNREETKLLEQYRTLPDQGREALRSVAEALCACRAEAEETAAEPRVIPLYRSPAAAGYAAPVFGEDFDYLPVTDQVPAADGPGQAGRQGGRPGGQEQQREQPGTHMGRPPFSSIWEDGRSAPDCGPLPPVQLNL